MKNTFKRIAAIALAVLMCVSAMMPAFAVENACPGTGRTHTAANCDYTEASKQEATCEVPGFVTGKCKTCGVVFSVSQTDALGHDYDAVIPATCETAASRLCKVCGEKEDLGEAVGHLYTAWATTNAEGKCVVGESVVRTCVYCGEKQTKDVGLDGHFFVMVSYVEGTSCVTPGKATVKCAICGTEKVEEIKNSTTHTYVRWDSTLASLASYTDEQVNLFKSIAYNRKDVNAAKSTCLVKGAYSVLCLDCGDVKAVVDTTVGAHVLKGTDADKNGTIDYSEIEWTDAKDPTCDTAGNIKYTECTVCRAYFKDDGTKAVKLEKGKDATVIPAIHDNMPLYNDYNANETMTAYAAIKTTNTVFWEMEIVSYKKPTDTEPGKAVYGCPVCGLKPVADTTDANKIVGWEKDAKKEGVKAVEVEIPAFGGHVYYNNMTDAQKVRFLATVNKMTVEDYETWMADNKTTLAKQWKALGIVLTDKTQTKDTGYDYYDAATSTLKNILAFDSYVAATCVAPAEVEWKCLNYVVDKEGNIVLCCKSTTTKSVELSGEGFDAKGHNYNYAAPTTTAAKCDEDGLNKYFCKAGCGEYIEEVIPALGHDYKTLTEAMVKGSNTYYYFDDNDAYTKIITTGTPAAGEALYAPVSCEIDGYEYTYCANCSKQTTGTYNGQFEVVAVWTEADGESHKWTYNDFKYDSVTYTCDSTKVNGTTIKDAYAFLAALDCGTSVNVERYCSDTNCKANEEIVNVTVKGPEHSYINTESKTVLAKLDLLTVGGTIQAGALDATLTGTAATKVVATCNREGNCEKTAKYKLTCTNGNCQTFINFEVEGDYAKGHVKTYIENTAKATAHGETVSANYGHSNVWVCSVDGCANYYDVKAYGAPKTIAEVAAKSCTVGKDDNANYGNGHELWDAEDEKFVTVTYKNVPDANVSGAATATKAQDVEAPVVNGEVVRYVEIPGTTLIWVYKYTEDTNHAELTSTKGGFYCVECNATIGTKAPKATVTLPTDCATNNNFKTTTNSAKCGEPTISTVTCKDCFASYQSAWTYTQVHNFNGVLTTKGDLIGYNDVTYTTLKTSYTTITANVAAAKSALTGTTKEALADSYVFVAPTCTRAGYVIAKCTEDDCGLVKVVSLEAHGHHDKNDNVVVDSCLESTSVTKCNDCGYRFNFDHKFVDNVCTECGETK